MAYRRIYFIFLILFSFSCLLSAQEIHNEDVTFNKDKVDWLWRIQVGDIPFDIPVKAEFTIKNNSNEPLIIKEVHTACHCTVIDFPKEPVEKGMTATIIATYDAKSEGPFCKIITVKTNFDPDHSVPLAVIGNVKARHQ